MEKLNQDALHLIFYRLPAKAVGKSRCVSKQWNHYLSQPEFIKNHFRRTKPLPRDEESFILVSEDRYSLYSIQLNKNHVYGNGNVDIVPKKLFQFKDRYPSLGFERIISCDGLVLVHCNQKWYLLNPTTRERKKLPRLPYSSTKFSICGLGYDIVSDDYKVIAVADDMDGGNRPDILVNVYSVRNGTWRVINCSSSHQILDDDYFPAETIDGRIHWVASESVDSPDVIATFDLAEERFCEVPLPPSSSFNSSGFGSTHGIAVLNGCLCTYCEDTENCESDVWIMKKYGAEDSWAKFKIINNNDDDDECQLKLLCMLGKDQLVMLKGERFDEKELVIYNLKGQSFTHIIGLEGTNALNIGETFTFIESLISPQCGN